MKIHFSKLVVAILVLAVVLTSRKALALDTSQITFPISQLGSCADVSACKLYCSQPANYATCQAFAASHQLTPPLPASLNKDQLLSDAQNFLGCTSYDTCKTFCQNPQNQEKCSQFSAREKLNRQSNAPVSPNIVQSFYQATQTELGCNSELPCHSLCNIPANFQRCTLFAMHHNLFTPHLLPPTPLATPSGNLYPPTPRPYLYPGTTPSGQYTYPPTPNTPGSYTYPNFPPH